jgi:hypothetical protein
VILTRNEIAGVVVCLAVLLVGALVWAVATWGGPSARTVTPDPWPVVVRDGVSVHPEDLDR